MARANQSIDYLAGRTEGIDDIIKDKLEAKPTREYQYIRQNLSKAVIQSLGYKTQRQVPITDRRVWWKLGLVQDTQETAIDFLKRDHEKLEKDHSARLRDVEYALKELKEAFPSLKKYCDFNYAWQKHAEQVDARMVMPDKRKF